MSWGPAKRFWKDVSVAQKAGGFGVELDARPLKTPAKAALLVPCQPLADLIADEWCAVDEEIDPKSMRYTRAANAAIDKVVPQHAEVTQMLADYGGTDLLCYRATEPAELIARQMEAWDPLLDWADAALGARLKTTQGVLPIEQDPKALAKLHSEVSTLDAFSLTAFHDLVTLSGSLVIAFAVARNRIEPEFGWQVSRIDELYQQEQWGEDDEATALSALKQEDFYSAARIYALLQEG